MKTIITSILTAFTALSLTAQPVSLSTVYDSPEVMPEGVAEASIDIENLSVFSSNVTEEGRIQLHSINEQEKVLDVPAALWEGGCVPTSIGMIVMYWDMTGFPDLVRESGSHSFAVNPANYSIIANQAYYNDYYNPKDTTGNLKLDRSSEVDYNRPYTCIADFLRTSQSIAGCTSGATLSTEREYLPFWVKDKNPNYSLRMRSFSYSYYTGGLTNYQRELVIINEDSDDYVWFYPTRKTGYYTGANWEDEVIRGITFEDDRIWNFLVENIDAGRPLIGGVNAKVAEGVDHQIVVVGYSVREGKRYYAALNTWESEVKWYEFKSCMGNKGSFGLGELISFELTNNVAVTADSFDPNNLYKFYNPDTGAYFFTANRTEAAIVYNELKNSWHYQGPAFKVDETPSSNTTPVYRFYNSGSASHFYTASMAERDNVIATLSHTLTYEGVAFYASTVRGENQDPVYRFFLPKTSSHFFTNSLDEKNYLVKYGDPSYIRYEGVAWYSAPTYENPDRNRE